MDGKTRLTVERFLLLILIVTLIFGMRIAITAGAVKIPLIFCVGLPVLLLLFAYNCLIIEAKKFILIVVSLVFILISSLLSIFSGSDFSLNSLLYLLAFYLPIIFIYKNNENFRFLLSIFQVCIMIISLVGILQFMLQLVGGGFIDPFEAVPPKYMMENYNTHIPIMYGASLFKSNGIFMLEPSFYSKFIATAIVIEFVFFKRMKVIFLFILGYLFSFSGTGLIILVVAAFPILRLLGIKQVIVILILALVPTYFFFESGYGEVMMGRTGEFTSPESSAYIRFVAPYLAYYEFLKVSTLQVILLGSGPGTLESFSGILYSFNVDSALRLAHENAYIKLLIEYGLLGGIPFCILIIYSFFHQNQSRILSVVLFVNYSVLTGALLQAPTFYLCLLLGMLFVNEKEEKTLESVYTLPIENQVYPIAKYRRQF